MELWKYEAKVIYSWRKLHTTIRPSPTRMAYSLEAVSSHIVVLFGGRTSTTRLLNDVWIFSYEQRIWEQVHVNSYDPRSPPPQYDHAAVSVDSVMFIYGGLNTNRTCSADPWAFYFANYTWALITTVNSGPSPGGIKPCKAYAAASAGQLWIAIGCNIKQYQCPSPEIAVWTFIIRTRMW